MTIFPGPKTFKVTHMSHPDPCAEGDFSFGLDSMEFGQDAARIWCQCGQDLTVAKWRRTRKKKIKHVHQQQQTGRELNNHVRPITGSIFQR